jgi:hypothetical protein
MRLASCQSCLVESGISGPIVAVPPIVERQITGWHRCGSALQVRPSSSAASSTLKPPAINRAQRPASLSALGEFLPFDNGPQHKTPPQSVSPTRKAADLPNCETSLKGCLRFYHLSGQNQTSGRFDALPLGWRLCLAQRQPKIRLVGGGRFVWPSAKGNNDSLTRKEPVTWRHTPSLN